MAASIEVGAFLKMAENSLGNPFIENSQDIRALPIPLQFQLAKSIEAIAQDRYEPRELRTAIEVVSGARIFSGGIGEAVRAITKALIDNGGFELWENGNRSE